MKNSSYPGAVSQACDPSDREAETYENLGLALQTAWLNREPTSEKWETLVSKTGKEQLTKTPKVNL